MTLIQVMHRFNYNRSKNTKAIDGFISSSPRRPNVSQNPDGFSGQILRPQKNWLDDFDKPEGFRGRLSPNLTMSGKYDSLAPDTKRRFGHSGDNDANDPTIQKHIKRHHGRGWKIVIRMSLIVVIAILLTSGYLFGKAWWNAHKIFKGGGSSLAFQKNIDPHLLNGEGDGRVNILIIGKPGTGRPDDSPDATDSLMIVSLDIANKGIGLLSIPRDLPVDTEFGSTKINAIYVRAKQDALSENPDDQDAAEMAGLNRICEVVEEYMGVPINYYGLMDFTVLEEAVNILGGITITLDEDYYDDFMIIGGQPLDLKAGVQELDGGFALAYARSRHGEPTSDLGRGLHQQAVLLAIKDKAISMGTFANPLKISGLLDAFGNRLSTNLSIDDMMKVYNFIKEVSPENIKNYTLADKGEEVVNGSAVPLAGVDNYDDVRAFVRNKLKDGYITQENPSIIVLNGTTETGLADEQANVLRGYGYNVIQVADAPITVKATRLVDNTNGQKKYTLRYLEQRYNTVSVTSIDGMDLSSYIADFIIIVGP